MNYDVIVVGGGPTGLWLASELALARVRVAVLEKLRVPTALSKALGLQSRAMEMLEYRGILDRFTAGNPTPPFLNFGMFPLDLRKLDFHHPRGVIIPQARVEALLEEHAKELGAAIHRGHEVTKFHQDAQGVKVEVQMQSESFELEASSASFDRNHSLSEGCPVATHARPKTCTRDFFWFEFSESFEGLFLRIERDSFLPDS